VGREAGITEEQHRELAIYRTSDAFSELEKEVLEFATALSGTCVEVSDEVYEGIRKHLSDAQIIELTHAILRGADRARFNRALDAVQDDIPEGAYCLVREARVEENRPHSESTG
jgi:alkylhydroperoxidase family enzyme